MKQIKINLRIIFILLISMGTVTSYGQKIKKKATVKESDNAIKESTYKDVELSREVEAAKGSTVKIICSNQNLEIRKGSGDKVKLTTKVQVPQDNKETNEELMEKFGINIRSLNNRIDITAQSQHGNTFFYSGPNGDGSHRIDLQNMQFGFDRLLPQDKSRNQAMDRIKLQHEEMAMRQREKERLKEDLARVQRDKERVNKDMERVQKELKSQSENLKRNKVELKKLHKLDNIDTEKFYFDGDKMDMQAFKGLDNMKVWTDSLPGMIHMDIMKNLGADLNNKMRNSFKFSFSGMQQSNLVVYVPEDVKLEVENKYGNVNILDDCKDANVNISNGTFNARKFGNLKLVSKYTTVNIGDVEDAEIEFENGNFTAGNIRQLDIDSKFSTLELDNCVGMIIRSQNDNYNIESLDKLEGRKSYGTFRLNRLGKSFNLDGQNADLRIKNMNTTVEMVKINDRYADIRLPVKDLQNYSVNFNGKYSTVFGPFEKLSPDGNTINKSTDKSKSNSDSGGMYFDGHQNDQMGDHSPEVFTASVGDTKGSHTKFDLTCNQCTVDFK